MSRLRSSKGGRRWVYSLRVLVYEGIIILSSRYNDYIVPSGLKKFFRYPPSKFVSLNDKTCATRRHCCFLFSLHQLSLAFSFWLAFFPVREGEMSLLARCTRKPLFSRFFEKISDLTQSFRNWSWDGKCFLFRDQLNQ